MMNHHPPNNLGIWKRLRCQIIVFMRCFQLPEVMVLCCVSLILFRLLEVSRGASSSASLLQWTCHQLETTLPTMVLERTIIGKHTNNNTTQFWIGLVQWVFTLIQDALGIALWLPILNTLYYKMYLVLTSSSRQTYYSKQVTDLIYQFSMNYIPFVQHKIQQEGEEFRHKARTEIFAKDPKRIIRNTLPMSCIPHTVLLEELNKASFQENKNTFRGQISGTVYNVQDTKHNDLMTSVFGMYAYANPLHPGCWPKLNQCEAEIIQMVGQLLHNNNHNNNHTDITTTNKAITTTSADNSSSLSIGCITSGGTESILLAIRAHVVKYGYQRGITQPELICSSSAHAAVYKACEMYRIRPIVINVVNDNNNDKNTTYQLDPEQVIQAITPNTIMIYASAPSYPHGVFDPIQDLSQIAVQYNIGLHVDACLGGFIVAFYCPKEEKEKAPVFDFRNRGVTSMSIDTHKYGYCPKGTSVVLYRDVTLRHAQYFSYPHWTGGMYHTPTLAGSRSGALIACTWTSLLAIGHEEYTRRAHTIVKAVRTIAKGIEADIPDLQLITPREHQFVVVCIKSRDPTKLNIYRVLDGMKEDYGWGMNALQFPSAIHICVTLSIVPRVNEFLQNLKEVVQNIKLQNSNYSLGEKQQQHKRQADTGGTAGIYGTVGSTPAGPVGHLLDIYTDEMLTP